eukprot:5472422-Prymnesium_polylepis.1
MYVDWLNAMWPPTNATHQLYAFGQTGSSAASFADCFLTHLPPSVDLFLFEFAVVIGDPAGVALEQLTRRALSLRGAPAVLYTNFFAWGPPLAYSHAQKDPHAPAWPRFFSPVTELMRPSEAAARLGGSAPSWACMRPGRSGLQHET